MFIRNGALVISLRGKKNRKFYMSFRLLLTVLLAFCGVFPMLLNGYASMKVFVSDQISQKSVEVQGQAQVVASEIAKSEYLTGQPEPALDTEITQLSNLYEGRVMVINRSFKIICDTYKLDEGKINISEEVIRCFQGEASSTNEAESCYMEFVQPILSQGSGEVIGCLIVGASTESIYKTNIRMTQKNRDRALVVFLFLLPFCIAVAGLMTRPLKKITKELNKAADGDLEGVISVDDFRETKEVSDAFNRTLERLRRLDESRQQFVSNVSHELKTPITSMKILADSLLMQENVPVEIYEEFMNDIVHEIDRENQIITDLLTLVKMDKTQADLNIAPTNINELLSVLLKRISPIAETRNITIRLETLRQVVAEVDEVKLSLACNNII